MRKKRKHDRFYLYLVISLVLHLVLFYFFPVWEITGAAEGEGEGWENIGPVHFIELETEAQQDMLTEEAPEPEEEPQIEEDTAGDEDIEEPEIEDTEDVAVEPDEPDIEETDFAEEEITEEPDTDPVEDTDTEIDETEQEAVDSETEEILTAEDSEQEIIMEEEASEAEEQIDSEEELPAEEIQEDEGTEIEADQETEVAGEDEEEVIPESGDLVSGSPISYPKDAVSRGETGEVILRAEVNDRGTLEELILVTSSGNNQMDQVAQLTIENEWSFDSYQSGYSIDIFIVFEDPATESINVNMEDPDFR